MKMIVVSVRDDLVGHINLCLENSCETARRSFAASIRNRNSLTYANPGDFRLYKLGTFDTDSGDLVIEEPEVLCTGLDFKEVRNEASE